jgi:hypothetical protein
MRSGFPNEKELEQLVAYEKTKTIRFMRMFVRGWAHDNQNCAEMGVLPLDERLQNLSKDTDRISLPEGLKTAGDICMQYKWYDWAAKCYSSMGSKEGWGLAGDAYMEQYYFRYAALCYILSGMDKLAAGKIAGDGYAKRGELLAAQICYEMGWVD